MPDKEAFGPDMKWSDEARAKRSESAKKAAATRARKKAEVAERANYIETLGAEAVAEERHVAPVRAQALSKSGMRAYAYPAEKLTASQKRLIRPTYPYFQGSRTARLAVCSVSRLALVTAMRG